MYVLYSISEMISAISSIDKQLFVSLRGLVILLEYTHLKSEWAGYARRDVLSSNLIIGLV